MRIRAADERRLQHARQGDVVDEPSPAGEKSGVLEARYRASDDARHDTFAARPERRSQRPNVGTNSSSIGSGAAMMACSAR